MTGRVQDKVAIVTGGGSGIGKATAQHLAAEGAKVAVVDIRTDRAESVAAEINGNGGAAIAITADVGEPEAVAAAVTATMTAFGRLNILHNNAALLDIDHMSADGDITHVDLDHWDRTLRVNVRGYMLGCRYGIPAMITSGGGSIINTSSQAAVRGDVRLSAYGASKGAINSLTRYVATQYGKAGVRCNAIMPGIVVSGDEADRPEPNPVDDLFLRHTLTPWLGTPHDIAQLVLFLASDESRYITGQLIGIDGGFAIHAPTFGDPVWDALADPGDT